MIPGQTFPSVSVRLQVCLRSSNHKCWRLSRSHFFKEQNIGSGFCCFHSSVFFLQMTSTMGMKTMIQGQRIGRIPDHWKPLFGCFNVELHLILCPAILENLLALVIFSTLLTIFTTSDSYDRQPYFLLSSLSLLHLIATMMLSGSSGDKHPGWSNCFIIKHNGGFYLYFYKNISKASERGPQKCFAIHQKLLLNNHDLS